MRLILITLLLLLPGLIEPSSAIAMRKGAPFPELGSCEYYKFLESLSNCGPEGYPMAFGLSNCMKISKTQGLTPEGVLWLEKARTCLQKRLEAARAISDAPLSCAALREIAFDSHTPCYLNPENSEETGPSICDLPFSDVSKIFKRINKTHLMSSPALQTTLKIAEHCAFHHRLRHAKAGNDQEALKQRLDFWEKLPHD
jgi:hypothetical protein